ncbi:MAG: bifunctional diaminohydroxyphosphoribosylaminopyrimidine deaminase/5-amino-6-(5-phosphoribosylamino)uracil reductase RibD [Bacteroidetes bacterium]|nr:bifunctional diaminohydroxyphosphoribosylaminopyrimidine deaminase/5-amino-6-(5-phosphoribosylamino)uracil reductase RibD [Bacteroidota bacterium]
MPHLDYLYQAFQLAKQANATQIRPNPFVGAVVVDEKGVVIGEGFHQQYGGAHAEVFAINAALEKIGDLSKTTLYVTLEPCSHYGKTPPCTNLILQHKIPRIVIGSLDSNPKVLGVNLLKQNGVEVIELLIPEIEKMNEIFFTNQKKKRPFIQLKMATTINGKIADRFGNSQWISNVSSRKYVHQELRNNVDAILTTAKNIIQDKASLNIRIDETIKELSVIAIDRDLDLLKPEHQSLSIFYERTDTKIYLLSNKTSDNLPQKVEIVNVEFDENNSLILDGLGEKLLQLNICKVLLEAGSKLSSHLINNNWADELIVFVAPKIIMDKQAINFIETDSEQLLSNATNLELLETKVLDGDIVLKYHFT